MSAKTVPESRPEHPERVVKVQEAKTRLSSLLREVETGSEIVISRGSTAVARLVPVDAPPQGDRRRPMGFLRFQVPDTFFEELPEEELRAWEGDA
ncbi:type II toxin-antitoxin system prevent-host-death family antitoxin [Brachybacterium vulturis]|uniref:Antitoxin n=1 Tax=Brachybacterium vulturis TaxID=2017484 RepID=A0A291GJ69_9MICO|nr:type II toxin-antitoxin system prevent-host-death family antitoxin [Brachybacterium vulturis]ATG50261.1 type II toxin-antitoxin system prevent-host-death family antitoxin [Brachybacterium vulturis]